MVRLHQLGVEYRDIFNRMPMEPINSINELVPAEINGSVCPVGGMQPVTTPRLIGHLDGDHGGDAHGQVAAKGLGHVSATRTPRQISAPYTNNSATTPTKPSSSAMMAKMKSLSLYGRYSSFCWLRPNPLPNRPARAKGVERLDELVAVATGVGPGIQKHEHAFYAVRLYDQDQHRHGRQARQA